MNISIYLTVLNFLHFYMFVGTHVRVDATTSSILFQCPIDPSRAKKRVSGVGTKSLSNVLKYSQCTQLCLLEYKSGCTFVNYNEDLQTCEISGSDLVNPYSYAVTDEPGWSHKLNYGPSSLEWSYFRNGWDLVFKATKNNGHSVYDLWTGSTTTQLSADLVQLQTGSSTGHFKSEKVENWANLAVKKVKFAYFDGGVEVFSLVFDGAGSDKMNWFSKSRLLEDPYDDLSFTSTTHCFNIAGCWGNHRRRFYLAHSGGTCETDAGWMVVVDGIGGCSGWDGPATGKPFFAYSKLATQVNWTQKWGGADVGFPEIMAIFLQY